MRSAVFSAIITIADMMFPDVTTGMLEPSTTRRPFTPRTLRRGPRNVGEVIVMMISMIRRGRIIITMMVVIKTAIVIAMI